MTTATTIRPAFQLKPRTRKTVLVIHVISSVGWLGLTLGNLILAVTGLTTDDPRVQHGVYLVLGVLGDWALRPISLLAFTTGLIAALCTPWGLFKHRWVSVKFWLILTTLFLTWFSLVPGIHEAVRIVQATPADRLADLGKGDVDLVFAACVSGTAYTFATVLSIFKPRLRRRG